jgi:bifunctional UDP-N-acetylglucosamine pyrophosphorylase/glucosamine-1-phosphate N-acetyltransferase
VLDPATTWVDLNARIGRGTVIYPSVVIEGETRIGEQCRIYPFVHLVDVHLGDRVKVLSSTMLERSRVEDDAQVGPFAHFRPNTLVRSRQGGEFRRDEEYGFRQGIQGRTPFLPGDRSSENVNIGAGTITCNHDGIKIPNRDRGRGLYRLAPSSSRVSGRRAYVGAGSVITKDVSPEALAVARGRQIEKPGWARRKKTK